MLIGIPRYKCHKEVQALKIKRITHEYNENISYNSYYLEFEEACVPGITVTDIWYEHHKPEIGGYYVIYKDGYSSYSPAKAFEEGYTRIEE